MAKLAYAMAQFDSWLDYRKALSFLNRRAENGDVVWYKECSLQSNVEIMCYLYWNEA